MSKPLKVDVEHIRATYSLKEYVSRHNKVRQRGSEIVCLCPFHAEDGASFSVYSKNGHEQFKCFGCGRSGDILDYVQEQYGLSGASRLIAAAEILDGKQGGRKPKERKHVTERAQAPDPYDAVEPQTDIPDLHGNETIKLFNPKSGNWSNVKCQFVHPYFTDSGDLLGYVIRHTIDGKKITPFIAWVADKKTGELCWSYYKFPEVIPLYRLPEVQEADPKKQAVILEGEKKPDMLAELGLNVVPVGFAYGIKSWFRTDWTPLKGRHVLLMPDADNESMDGFFGHYDKRQGRHIMGLAQYLRDVVGVKSLKWVERPSWKVDKGWNIDDAIQGGWTVDEVKQFMKEQIRNDVDAVIEARSKDPGMMPVEQAPEKPTPEPVEQVKHTDNVVPLRPNVKEEERTVAGQPPSPNHWRRGTHPAENGEGLAKTSFHNWERWLTWHPMVWRVWSYNEMSGRVIWLRRMPWHTQDHQSWSFEDATKLRGYMDRDGLTCKQEDIIKVVNTLAKDTEIFHPIRSYLDGLTWDGTPRIDKWLVTYAGAKDRPTTGIFGRKWLIGAAARIMAPSCKMDTMLILEGPQGIGKSTLFQVLASPVDRGHFSDDVKDVGSERTAHQSLGKWIIEMSELGAMSRSSTNDMKTWLARQSDEFKKPYAVEFEAHPRQFVVGGTVNPNGQGYLKDETGNRRFWPVAVTRIDLVGLLRDRDQLWAEAVALYKAGEIWHLTPEEDIEAKKIQDTRAVEEVWEDHIKEYVTQKNRVLVSDVLFHACSVPKDRQDQRASNRVTSVLKRLGWRPKVSNGKRFWDRGDQ